MDSRQYGAILLSKVQSYHTADLATTGDSFAYVSPICMDITPESSDKCDVYCVNIFVCPGEPLQELPSSTRDQCLHRANTVHTAAVVYYESTCRRETREKKKVGTPSTHPDRVA